MDRPDKTPKKDQEKNELEMNMAFFAPEELAKLLPPEDVRIIDLAAEPYEDGQRVRVNIEMSPFEQRPHLEINLCDAEEQEISHASFVEPMTWKLEFTMHLRKKPVPGPLDLEARLFYPDGPEAEPVKVRFDLAPPRGLDQS